MAQREHVTPSSALELFLDAFDGMPIQGCHELRLSPQELAELTGLFPSAGGVDRWKTMVRGFHRISYIEKGCGVPQPFVSNILPLCAPGCPVHRGASVRTIQSHNPPVPAIWRADFVLS